VRAIDLRTLVDASRSLGASWFTTLVRVILPNVESAVLGAMFLTVALCLGEVVIATIMLYTTFPVELVQVGQSGSGAEVSVALSIASLLFVFLLLFSLSFIAGRRRGSTSVRVI
jgi:putative spermidine/putrescine transport system permease protein